MGGEQPLPKNSTSRIFGSPGLRLGPSSLAFSTDPALYVADGLATHVKHSTGFRNVGRARYKYGASAPALTSFVSLYAVQRCPSTVASYKMRECGAPRFAGSRSA